MSAASELKFMEQAERLAGNLTSLRKRSFRLTRELDELRRNAQKQLEDLYRTEVRLTTGSFQSHFHRFHTSFFFLLLLILFNSVSHRRKLIFSCVIVFFLSVTHGKIDPNYFHFVSHTTVVSPSGEFFFFFFF